MATATKPVASFPTLEQRPDAYVLLFDGHCRFCRANTWWISAVDQGKVAYVSLHDPVVAIRWPELTHDQLMKHMYLLDGEDKYPGAAAVRFLSRKLIALWPLMPLMHIPGSLPVWQFIYNKIARVRYAFGRVAPEDPECENGACSVHFD